MADKNSNNLEPRIVRTNSNMMLDAVVFGIRPTFEENKEQKEQDTKKETQKKSKHKDKRYRRVFVRIQHSKEGDESSYSSLQSEWQTIRSIDERAPSNLHLSDLDAHEYINKNIKSNEEMCVEIKDKSKEDGEAENKSKSKINEKSIILKDGEEESDNA